jgi:hypothetical protein
MRTLALIPTLLAFLATTVLAQNEIYLSARADGKGGTGAAADPLNASTQAKFDAIFASLKPNTAVHIGEGTYHTKGEASFKVQPNTKLRAAGGYIRAMHYGYTTPTPEGVNVFSGNGQELHMLKNFIISGNVIRPYSSDGKNRIPSTGIRVCGAENAQIFNNVVFDSGNHCGLVVASTKKVKSSVICRDNYNGDNTPALPRDDKGN